MQETARDVRVLLHNIRSAHNVGAIFRTADALGVSRVYLSGYTPCPLDRFGRPVKDIAKTALGAERTIPWEHERTFGVPLRRAMREGFTVVGVEQDKRAIDYKRFQVPEKVVLVVGNEVVGLSPALRKHCTTLLEIPMRGTKESLNVAVAFGIVLFRLFDR
jgi:23S rRNA (guanosine2251-2'-O)-methyltransferase